MVDENILRLNLQMFNNEGTDDDLEPSGDNGADGGNEETPLTFDDVLTNKEYQAEFDRRLDKALDTARVNWEKKAKEDAESFNNLDDDEKQRIKALEERECELNRRELKATAIDILAEKELPIKLAEVLYYENENTTKEHIDAVEAAFNDALKTEVDNRLASSVDVPGGNGNYSNTHTRSERIAKERNEQQKTSSLWG